MEEHEQKADGSDDANCENFGQPDSWKERVAGDQSHGSFTAKGTGKSGNTTHDAVKDAMIKAGTWIAWDGWEWQVVKRGASEVILRREGHLMTLRHDEFEKLLQGGQFISTEPERSARKAIMNASCKDMKLANWRYEEIVAPRLRGEKVICVTPREQRRWVQRYREAEALWGVGWFGLLPEPSK